MRKVYCFKLKKDLDGLEFVVYPGSLGKKIFNSISKKAWQMWMQKQTMLINEKHLNMSNSEHRLQLESFMVKFLFEEEDVFIEGYSPKN